MTQIQWWVEHGDAIEALKVIPDGSIDALVTDPPAGIGFMGKEWDGSKGGRDKWIAWLAGILTECRRAVKPGAYGWVWALPRTAHWTAGVLVKNARCKIEAMCGTHRADLWKSKWVVTVECTCIDRTTNRRTLVQLAKVFAAFESTHECGARCINATGPSCECACRGKNHGRHN